MQSDIPGSSISSSSLWAGRILSGLAALFMIFDGVIHVLKISPVYIALLVWGGIYLCDDRVRAMIPLRR